MATNHSKKKNNTMSTKKKTVFVPISFNVDEYAVVGSTVIISAAAKHCNDKLSQYALFREKYPSAGSVGYFFAPDRLVWAKMYLESEPYCRKRQLSLQDFQKMVHQSQYAR